MNQHEKIVDRVRAAINTELAKHEAELEAPGADSATVHLTVKLNKRKVKKVIFSNTTETEID